MKHLFSYFLGLLAALLPFASTAAPVSAEKAQAKAVAFFQQSTRTRTAPSLQLVWDGESASTRASADPALFVFNRTDAPGFVILAGDDAVAPVLGYSFENGFGNVDRMPENLRYWLETIREMVLEARASGAGADAGWSASILKSGDPVKELSTALWNQSDPYNAECPIIDGTLGLTGCTQTAEAIVLKYNRWPTTVNRTVDGYTMSSGIYVEGRTLGSYNYDLMPDVYDGTATAEQKAEIARLMADLGVLNKAEYEKGSTGAYYTDMLYGLGTVLKYSKSARMLMRDGFSDEEWFALMRNEIDADRPVLYAGERASGAHAFVLDGYSTGSDFHFNWGWGGSSNGWFSVAKLTPTITYSLGQYAIVDLVKDPDEETTAFNDNLALMAYGDYVGLKSAATSYKKGDTFTMSQFCYYTNIGLTDYSGEVALALFAEDGTLKERLTLHRSSGDCTSIPCTLAQYWSDGVINLSCTINSDIRPGDFIAGAFLNNATGQWERMRAYDTETVAEIVVMPKAETAEDIAKVTSLSFNRSTKTLSLSTVMELSCRVTSADGSVKYDAPIAENGELVLDVSKWAAGTYTLSLAYENGEPYTLRIVL